MIFGTNLLTQSRVPVSVFSLFQSIAEKENQTVGDITTGHKPAYLGRINFISSSKVLKPKEADKGPGPVVGLQPVAVHQLCAHTCNMSQEQGETNPNTSMNRCWDSLNRQASPMYIRGRPGGGSRTTDNNSRHRRSLFAPQSSKPHQFHHNYTQALPSSKGPNQYKTLLRPLSTLTPSS